ncbi:MAG: alpha/beta fold hydrolase [Rhodospirillales bacterium]|nr:alpha/beta fold hydrolase [Rhodospirillales bacterium]
MLTLGDMALEAATWGDTPSLVLLHEGLGSISLWRDFPRHLAARTGLGVFAWSRRGYGGSSPAKLPAPLDYMQREAELLPRVLDAAGIGRCVLIGHSDGGTIAALARDERIAARVLIAPHFFVEDVSVTSIRAIGERYAELRPRLARHHRDPDTIFRFWHDAWLDPGFPAALFLDEPCRSMPGPALVLQGSRDQYGTLAQAHFLAERACGPVEIAVLDAAHAPHLEAPEASLDAIGRFLSEQYISCIPKTSAL